MKSTGCFLITILSLFMTLFCLLFLYLGGVGTKYYLVKANFEKTNINYIGFTPTEYCISNNGYVSCHSDISFISNLDFLKTSRIDNNLIDTYTQQLSNLQNEIKKYFVDITNIWIDYSIYVKVLFFILFAILSLAILLSLLTFKNYKFISYACIVTGSIFVLLTTLSIVVLVSFIKISNYIGSSIISPYVTLEYLNSIYGLCIILILLVCSFIFLVTIRQDEYSRHESRELRRHQVQMRQQYQNSDYSSNIVVELDRNQTFVIDDNNEEIRELNCNKIQDESIDYIYLPTGAEIVYNDTNVSNNELKVINS